MAPFLERKIDIVIVHFPPKPFSRRSTPCPRSTPRVEPSGHTVAAVSHRGSKLHAAPWCWQARCCCSFGAKAITTSPRWASDFLVCNLFLCVTHTDLDLF